MEIIKMLVILKEKITIENYAQVLIDIHVNCNNKILYQLFIIVFFTIKFDVFTYPIMCTPTRNLFIVKIIYLTYQ